jgi:endonuclease/exonuclease/phosphatase family metal-dependent hydrolase
MLTFLFWNTNGKPLVEAIVGLAEEQSVDVLMLAECDVAPARLLIALNRNESLFYFAPGNSPRLAMFTKFPDRYVAPVFESDRVSIRRLALPAREEILLVLVHFPSKLYWSEDSQMLECTVLASTIVDEERHAGHSRTILVGDLNMNPFEKGLVGASGLHATMARTVAERASRVVQGKTYSFFYNPMWGHLGDWIERPPGSFYYERAEQVTYFWNTFDQVLIRPALLDRFRSDEVRILDRVGEESLTTDDGRPDGTIASDHFPLLFKIDM